MKGCTVKMRRRSDFSGKVKGGGFAKNGRTDLSRQSRTENEEVSKKRQWLQGHLSEKIGMATHKRGKEKTATTDVSKRIKKRGIWKGGDSRRQLQR